MSIRFVGRLLAYIYTSSCVLHGTDVITTIEYRCKSVLSQYWSLYEIKGCLLVTRITITVSTGSETFVEYYISHPPKCSVCFYFLTVMFSSCLICAFTCCLYCVSTFLSCSMKSLLPSLSVGFYFSVALNKQTKKIRSCSNLASSKHPNCVIGSFKPPSALFIVVISLTVTCKLVINVSCDFGIIY